MKTRNGIYYNIEQSSYKWCIPDTHVTFYFSSDLHLCKFQDQYLSYRKEFNLKMKVHYKLDSDLNTYADVVLYKQIEKRGFYIVNEGGQKIWEALLNGEKVTPKN